jgi:hypothetical protein
MEAIARGFYLNCMPTGVERERLSAILTTHYHCADADGVTGLMEFLVNEGDRVAYQIMVPYLLSTESIDEFEEIIHRRFFGVERFVTQGKNLYNFVKYAEERRDPIIWYNDIQRGIAAWDMGQLVCLARLAREWGYIGQEEAWRYIEQANAICRETLRTREEIDKSYLLGSTMKSDKIDEWDQMLFCYAALDKQRK